MGDFECLVSIIAHVASFCGFDILCQILRVAKKWGACGGLQGDGSIEWQWAVWTSALPVECR